ncbi:hypothetical protein D7S89_26040 [Trinickia fusca]|uniref:ParB-like N-terminal domain-containing protein n=2 Tax=Trinickia fusca TaxID=2419777 RepID=A0A494X670_9BURK|nr:hypothetical protein D7S89_26040 [Trinickia fusca]
MIRRTVQRERAPMPLAERKYRYDAAGQLTEIEDRYQGYTDYRYDPIGRLIEAKSPVDRERFAFDPASNIVDPPATAGTRTSVSYAREDSTLPAQVPKVLGNLLKAYAGMHFAYDARGNLIHRRSAQGEQRYEWDAFNRLHAARVEEATRRSEARYYYDALGRRIAKDVNGTRTVFGWDGDTLAYETTEEGVTHYVYEADSFVPLVQFVADAVHGIPTLVWHPDDHYVPEEDPLRQVPQRTSDAHVFYYHCDQIGTPLMMTDELGEVVWEASYKAWGEAQQVIARASKAAGIAPKNPLRFQGQQLDDETGLAYNRHRYYDASVGRFISVDPIKLSGGFNLYQYAPASTGWIDPLGLNKTCPMMVNPRRLQSRQGPSEMTGNKVKRYASAMRAQGGYGAFPPVEAADVGDGKLVIVDGHHRAEAAMKAGIPEVPVNVAQVSPEEAEQLKEEADMAKAERLNRCQY